MTKTTEKRESPYTNGRREWNEQVANLVVTANNWRIIALGNVFVSLIAICGIVFLYSQQKIVPYAVEIDKNGEVIRVARANIASQPNKLQIIAALRNWVIGARTVYVDSKAEKALVEQTYAMTLDGSAAFQSISTFHRENNPYERAQNETVEINVNAIVPISDASWQIDWTEITKKRSGKLESAQKWQGTFTLTIVPPTSEGQVLINPLGIYVKSFAWTPRI